MTGDMSSMPMPNDNGMKFVGHKRLPGSPTPLERSAGLVELAFKRRGAVTALAHLHQQGCGKARLPRPTHDGRAEAVLINLAGGLTGGDRLEWRVAWRAGAEAVVSGQAAEKIYRAVQKSVAEIDTALTVEGGALAFWLPQETILFDRARLVRRNRCNVARGGQLVTVEATILGRRAMGEVVTSGLLDEAWEVRYGEQLVLADRQRFRGRITELLAAPAVARGAAAFVSVLYVGDGAATRLGRIRDALDDKPFAATAPAPHAVLIRWLAAEPTGLRGDIVTALLAVQDALDLPRHLPKIWSC